MHWGYGGMGWMMGWWSLFWIAIVIAVVWAIANGRARLPAGEGESPEAILKRRYARGEIDREEYERRLGDLRN